MGYSASDVVTTLFRVVRNYAALSEFVKLEYIKVGGRGAGWGAVGVDGWGRRSGLAGPSLGPAVAALKRRAAIGLSGIAGKWKAVGTGVRRLYRGRSGAWVRQRWGQELAAAASSDASWSPNPWTGA